MYLTYDEYRSYGGSLTQTAFTPFEFKARKRIDYLTDSRVANMAEIPEAVKLCMYALINMDHSIGAEAQASSPVVTSFSTDGYSENYGNSMNATEADKQMNKLVSEYLYGEKDDYGVPLLYRGVRG